MFKKLVSLVLAVVFVFTAAISLASCGESSGNDDENPVKVDKSLITGDPSAIKVGVVLIGDENEGYSYSHIKGIENAAAALGIAKSQILWKYSIAEDSACGDAITDLVQQGCDIIFTNSYGHQSYAEQAAREYPDVTFVAMTGDTAKKAGLPNFCNAFTKIYEARYVSGVVAGLKLKELIDKGELTKEKRPENFDKNGNIKIGYVGAYNYAEVVSGYTSFYLGIKSVVNNVVMQVQYTNSWFNPTAEATTAEALIADGCVVISQHADSTGAPSACQSAYEDGKLVFSVGYNVSMLKVAPDVALTSATNKWDRYYAYALLQIINGEPVATNWAEGYETDAVAITKLGKNVAEGTAEYVKGVIEKIKKGELQVFDTSTFTVNGQTVTEAFATDTDGDFVNDADNAVFDGYYHESYFQSAPSFSLRIDGIYEAREFED